MNDQMFDMYRRASESWFRMQQDLFEGLYRSAFHLFQQTSQVPAPQSSQDGPRIAGAEGSKASQAAPKPRSRTSTRSRKVAGKRPGR